MNLAIRASLAPRNGLFLLKGPKGKDDGQELPEERGEQLCEEDRRKRALAGEKCPAEKRHHIASSSMLKTSSRN